MRYLKNKVDGTIYEWDEVLAKNPKCVEVSEQEAYPERFVQPAMTEAVEKVRKRTKKPLDLTTEEVPEAPPYTDPELASEAAKGWPQ
jgi:hypothetical protein